VPGPRAGHISTTADWGVTKNSREDTSGTTVSPSFVETLTGGIACAQTFVAPPSGMVQVVNTAQMSNASATQTSLMSFVIREGGTIGSGTAFWAASDDDSLRNVGTNAFQGTYSVVIEGLVGGNTYNIRQAFRGSGATAASFSRKRLAVIPV
jgi:hypothetical protein